MSYKRSIVEVAEGHFRSFLIEQCWKSSDQLLIHSLQPTQPTKGHYFSQFIYNTHRWNDSIGLSLPEGNISICFYDDVASLSRGLRPYNPLNGLDLGLEWLLRAESVQWHIAFLELDRDLGLLVNCDGHLGRCLGCSRDEPWCRSLTPLVGYWGIESLHKWHI